MMISKHKDKLFFLSERPAQPFSSGFRGRDEDAGGQPESGSTARNAGIYEKTNRRRRDVQTAEKQTGTKPDADGDEKRAAQIRPF